MDKRLKLSTARPERESRQAALILAWQAGDRQAGNEVITELQPFIELFVHKWAWAWHNDIEDCKADMTLYALKAINIYNPALGTVSNILTHSLNNKGINKAAHASRNKRDVATPILSLDAPLESLNGDYATLGDIISACSVESDVDGEALFNAIATLPLKDRQLIQWRFEGLTMRQAAKKAGLRSRQACAARLDRIRRQLRWAFKGQLPTNKPVD